MISRLIAEDCKRAGVVVHGGTIMAVLSAFDPEKRPFYHWQVFEPEFLNENKPDVLVYEVVERDLGRMMEDLEKLMPNQ